jgi:Tol biopolymer transport system component
MGEVYRARDTRLDRTVAVKVLPTHLSSNPELRQRFEREARAISSLSHPHICHLYDVGSQNGTDFLVMEYLEGGTLADRLQKGPLSLEQVLKIGIEITDALDNAHRHGIVHRDLKPGNIMLTKSGAKLMDFGLARAAEGTMSPANSALATLTEGKPLTQEGSIVGTYQYMAPEQLEGGRVDARTDIFALSAVLYEATSGRMAFLGKTQASVIAAILASDPPSLTTLQPLTPPALDQLIHTCLAKDPDARIQSAHDLKLQLSWLRDSLQTGGAALRRRPRRDLVWLLALAILAGVAAFALLRGVTKSSSVLRASILLPGSHTLEWAGGFPALSPDGSRLALVAPDARGIPVLWIRNIAAAEAKLLPDTERAGFPFWSPDGTQLGFFADRKLKKIDLSAGGKPEVLLDESSARGGSWAPDGTILFTPGLNSPILRVPASGGSPQSVTQLDQSRGEISHRFPSFLPDGKHFLYFIRATDDEVSGVYVGVVGSFEKKQVLRDTSNAIFANGYLLFARGEELFAQRFDPKTMSIAGEPRQVAAGVNYVRAYDGAEVTASGNGILAFGPQFAPLSKLTWLDRNGAEVGTLGQPGYFRSARISPDGRMIAYLRLDPHNTDSDIWIYDLLRNSDSRLTYRPMWYAPPVWSPKSDQLAFTGNRTGTWSVSVRDINSDKERQLPMPAETATYSVPTSWSADGRYIAYQNSNPKRAWDMWTVPVDGGQPFPFVATQFSETDGQFSSDGKWMAYVSDESGAPDVYIRPFPGPGTKIRISSAGGSRPKWRHDGKELLYIDRESTVMSVDLSAGPERAGMPRRLFRLTNLVGDVLNNVGVDISPDGQRFLVQQSVKGDYVSRVELIVNWPGELNK